MIRSRIGRIVDVGIALLAVFTLLRLVEVKYRAAAVPDYRPVRPLALGMHLALPSIDWSSATRHVVLRVQTTCRACNESTDLYAEVSRRIHNTPGTQLLVLSNEPPERTGPWLATNRIQPHKVVVVDDPGTLGFLMIPTILLVDSLGQVTDILVERLTSTDEQSLWSRLNGTLEAAVDNTRYAREIDEKETRELIASGHAAVLDIRDREAFATGHRDGAINIPTDELSTRALTDLPRSEKVIVDCPGPTMAITCRITARRLAGLGVPEVVLRVR